MIYFSAKEILISVLAFFSYGIFCGELYSATESVLISLRQLLLLPYNAYRCAKDFSFFKIKETAYGKAPRLSPVSKNVFEFLLFLACGVVAVLLLYSLLDGVLRFYVVFLTVSAFFISKKTLGKLFSRIYNTVFLSVYFIALTLLSVILIPVLSCLKELSKSVLKLSSPVINYAKKARSRNLIKKKIRQIAKISV